MNLFDARTLAYVMGELLKTEVGFTQMKTLSQESPNDFLQNRAKESLKLADDFFRLHPLENCLEDVAQAKRQWERTGMHNSGACEIFHRLQDDVASALQSQLFLRVAKDRSDLIDQEQLFGNKVYEAFPSARGDIKEAGNCLAAECNTGAVFHLMRASEFALRTVAVDRKVSFANKPLSQQEWGTILGALEEILKQMRLDDGKKWAKPEFKEAQIRFYNGVVQELRSFNEVWRRHISHADQQAFYDRDQAKSTFNHVQLFMQKLSICITENTTMPEYWITE